MAQFIDIEARSALEFLVNIEGRLANTKPLMQDIAGVMADAVEENFRQEGRPKWVDLKEATKERRRNPGKGKNPTWPGKILQVSQGGLAASISSKATEDEATVSSGKKYAATHNFGDESRGIPQREFLTLGEDDLEEIQELAIDYLDL